MDPGSPHPNLVARVSSQVSWAALREHTSAANSRTAIAIAAMRLERPLLALSRSNPTPVPTRAKDSLTPAAAVILAGAMPAVAAIPGAAGSQWGY